MRKKTAHKHSSFPPSLITETDNEALLFLIVSAASLNVLGRPWLLRDTDPSIFDSPASLGPRFRSGVKDVHVGAKWQSSSLTSGGCGSEVALTCDWFEPSSDKQIKAFEVNRHTHTHARKHTRTKTRNQTDSNTLMQACVWDSVLIGQRTGFYCTAEAIHTSHAAATVAMEKMDSQPACGHTMPVYVQHVLVSLWVYL